LEFGALPVATAQPTFEGKASNFTMSEYFDAPNETQMKSLITGAEAQPQPGGRYLIKGLRLELFGEKGERQMTVEAPECVYDGAKRLANSSGRMQAKTGDGRYSIEGEGFLWQQDTSSINISNHVHSVIRSDLLTSRAAGGAPPSNSLVRAGENIEVSSDQFTYERAAGRFVYRDNVRVAGTNLHLTAGVLSLTQPATSNAVETLLAERDVVMDQADAHFTGDSALYAVADDTFTWTGQPTWRLGSREGHGDRLVMDRSNGVFRVSGRACLKLPGTALGTGFAPEGSSAADAPAATNQLIEVLADNYELRTNRATFKGGVRVSQLTDGRVTGKMSSAQLTVAMSGSNAVQTMIAEDNVVVEQGDSRFTGARAVFTGTNSVAEFSGNPTWRAGSREGSGDLLTVDTAHSTLIARGNAHMRLPHDQIAMSTTTNAPVTATVTNAAAGMFAMVSSDEYEVKRGQADFRGHVRVDDPQMKLTCETVTAVMSETGGKAGRIVAEKNVVIDMPDENGQTNRATGEKVVYTYEVVNGVTNQTAVLTGYPRYDSRDGWLKGNKADDKIIWDRTNNKFHAEGDISSGSYAVVGTNQPPAAVEKPKP
jgi:lipopolysaccharide export system protein LptA